MQNPSALDKSTVQIGLWAKLESLNLGCFLSSTVYVDSSREEQPTGELDTLMFVFFTIIIHVIHVPLSGHNVVADAVKYKCVTYARRTF